MSEADLLRKRTDTFSVLDAVCAVLLALCPLLQNYEGLLVDARATVLVLLTPYILIRFWNHNQIKWLLIAPMLIFAVYKVLVGGISIMTLGREGMACLFLLAAASGIIDIKTFIRAITVISLIASALIVVQYVCYYVFDFHLQLVPTSLFLESSQKWVGLAETGRISILGNPMKMYRPSSFFLEPAHMAIYCTPSVLLLLITPGVNRLRIALASMITLGVLASTSGIGIALCVGIWVLYLAFYLGEDKESKPLGIGKWKIKGFTIKPFEWKGIPCGKRRLLAFRFKGVTIRPINIVFILSMVVVLVCGYLFVDVFRNSVNRVLFPEPGGYNAISGRTNSGIVALSRMHGIDWLFGKQVPGPEAKWYMSAFFETTYKYGLIGFVLSYIFYVVSLIQLKRQHFWMALMILGLSLFSVHTHGSAYLLFYCFLLLVGHQEGGTDDPRSASLRIHPFGWQNGCPFSCPFRRSK